MRKINLPVLAGAFLLWFATLPQAATAQIRSKAPLGARPLKSVQKGVPAFAPTTKEFKPAGVAAGVPNVIGSVIFADNWSEYHYGAATFPLQANTTLTMRKEDANLNANGGAVLQDNIYKVVNYNSEFGFAIYSKWDIDNWERTETPGLIKTECAATAVSQDPTDGKVYGCFYEIDDSGYIGNKYVFGTVDYTLKKRTNIGTLDSLFVGIAASPQGEIFGIRSDGMLCKINKLTGGVWPIGSTGLKPMRALQSAAFDPASGKLYWAASLKDGTGALYLIDTNTGAATLFSRFPHNEEIVGMCIEAPAAPLEAPDSATNIRLDFPTGALNGTITFTAPTKAYNGTTTLTGELTYTVLSHGKQIATGSVEPGASVTTPSFTETQGYDTLRVYCSNSAGNGVTKKIVKWFGLDTPQPVTNVKLAVDGLKATLTWNAPKGGIHDGYADPEALTYKIVRQPDGATMATSLKGTTYNETFPQGTVRSLAYSVTPINGSLAGEETASSQEFVGQALTPPYKNEFTTEEDFKNMTVVDANNDGETWIYWDRMGELCARCGHYRGTSDDWLVTPPIRLKANTKYKVYLKAKGFASFYTEKFSVRLGTANTANALASGTSAIPTTTVKTGEWTIYSNEITIDNDGVYYLGVHNEGDNNSNFLYIDSLGIEGGVSQAVPAKPENLKLIADAQGATKVTVSFNHPSKTLEGNALTAITSTEVYRDGELVKKFDNPQPGSAVSFEDPNADTGMNHYTVYSTNAMGKGAVALDSVYCGEDVPGAPTDVVLKDKGDHVHLSWKAPTIGANGGYIDTSSLSYLLQDNSYALLDVIEDATSTDRTPDVTGTQRLLYYGVSAVSSSTQSIGATGVSNAIVIGDAYKLPFSETFSQGNEAKYWAGINNGKLIKVIGGTDQNGDQGYISMQLNDSVTASTLTSGKISLAGSVNPVLQFYYYADPAKNAMLVTKVTDQDETSDAVDVEQYSALSGKAGWRKVEVPLTEYINKPYITLHFEGTSTDGTAISIDNISVKDVLTHNLAATIKAPGSVLADKDNKVTVTVTNEGTEANGDATVDLYMNGKKIESKAVTSLAPEASANYSFNVSPGVNAGSKVELYAYVDYADDQKLANNTTDTVMSKVQMPSYPTVTLNGSLNANNQSVLTWNAPNLSNVQGQVTDGAEDYDAFSIDSYGEWTLIDGDGATTSGIGDGWGSIYKYPNVNKPMAYMIFNPSEAKIRDSKYSDEESTKYAPHSGKQVFAAFSANGVRNNDWLISPRLNGKAQTISFWAKTANTVFGYETFEILYSTQSTDTATFVKIGGSDKTPDEWTKYTAQLPEGTRYFAIRCTSDNHQAFLVDDITYTAYTAEDLVVSGYNIYRNGERLNSTPIAATSYTDSNVPADAEYQVSVVYTIGESALSNIVCLQVPDGIAAVDALQNDILTGHGAIVLKNATGEPVIICNIAGAVVYKGCDNNVNLHVPAGIYLIKCAGNTVKVTVK